MITLSGFLRNSHTDLLSKHSALIFPSLNEISLLQASSLGQVKLKVFYVFRMLSVTFCTLCHRFITDAHDILAIYFTFPLTR